MTRDEFNVVEITNEKQVMKVEFGKAQSTEYSFHNDNTVPKGELNEKYVGKTIKKQTEINVQYSKNIPAHGSETVVTSTTTATTVAATTSSVVVAASTVAVAAVAVATGISVALHDYEYKFNSFVVTSDSLTYELFIKDNKKEDEQYDYELQEYNKIHKNNADEIDEPHEEQSEDFILRVYNDNYDNSNTAYLNYNYGTFTGLSLGEVYHITLTESRYGGETIFDETFSTAPRTRFYSFYLSDQADFKNNAFYVDLDFIDENDQFSDFTLTFLEDDGLVSFPLEKVTGRQKVSQGNTNFRPVDTHNYRFSYKDNGEVVEYEEGSITFVDNTGGSSVANRVIWDKSANYVTKEFKLRLDYQDDFDFYSNFHLKLTQNENVVDDFDLEKTLNQQTLTLVNIDPSQSCSYLFTYLDRGNTVILEEGTVLFTDNSEGVSEVTGVTWDKTANFLERSFEVKLNYRDDFNRFSDFALILSSMESTNSFQETFILSKATVVQTVHLPDNSMIDFDNTYNYEFIYQDDGEEKTIESGTVKFTDNSGSVSEVTGVTWNKKVNYLTNEMNVTLAYRDDLSRFTDFAFTISEKNADAVNSGTFPLEKTTAQQTIILSSQSFTFKYDTEYDYSFTYQDKGVEQVIDSGSALITDSSEAISEVTGVTWDKSVNYLTSVMEFTLVYQDDLNRFTDFAFYIEENTDEEPQSATFSLEKVTTKQSITLNTDTFEFDYDQEYKYSFTYKDLGVSMTIDSGTVKFTDNSGSVSEVTGVTWNKKVNYLTSEMTVKLDYTDDLDRFSDFKFNIEEFIETGDVGGGAIAEPIEADSGSFSLAKTTEEQTITLISDSFVFDYEKAYTYSFTYLDKDEEQTVPGGSSSEPQVFADSSSSVSEVTGVTWDGTANYLTSEIEVTLAYTDDLSRFSNFAFHISEQDAEPANSGTFPLTKTIAKQTVTLSSASFEFKYETYYDYSFTYEDRGVEMTIDSGSTLIADNSGTVSEVTGVAWDGTISYVTKAIELTLGYSDEFSYFTEFAFYIEDNEESEKNGTFPLSKTTEAQTITLISEDFVYEYGHTYKYSLKYLDRGVETAKNYEAITPTDNSGSVTSFDGLDFEKAANFITREFDVKLNYTDDLDRMSDFTFVLKDQVTLETKTFDLEKSEEVQTLVCNDYDEDNERYPVDIVANDMSYSFYYYLDGVKQDVVTDEEFTFTNTLHSEITTVSTTYNYASGVPANEGGESSGLPYGLPIKLAFNDEEEKWSGFHVTINERGSDTVVAELSYINDGENLKDGKWHYLMEPEVDFFISDVIGEFDLVIWGDLYRENALGEMQEEVYRETHDFTLDRETEFHDFLVCTHFITGGSYLQVFPVFSGYAAQTKMILEIRTAENTYRYEINVLGTIRDGVNIDLSSAMEENWDQEVFAGEIGSAGVDIYLYYYTYPVNISGLSPSELEELEPTEEQYTQLVLYSNYHLEFEA